MNISISPINPLNLLIQGKTTVLRDIKEYFTEFAPGYQYQWLYQAGRWDGRVSVFDRKTKELPTGLLFDLIKFKKEYYPDDKWTLSQEVKDLYKGIDIDFIWNLKYQPRDYQEECIRAALKINRGIFRVATAGGKSLIIAYIWKHLYENNLAKQTFIIVPNLNLITQFHNDLIDYGVNPDLIGEVWSKAKEWDKEIVISTWQSLSKHPEYCKKIDCVIWDEVHGASSIEAKKLLSLMTNAKYRFGCTGTMPDSKLDAWNVTSYLGPVFKEYSAKYLREAGWIAPCTIKQIEINYERKIKKSDTFSEVKDDLFNNTFRLNLIKDRILDIKENVKLLLVEKVEEGGEVLKNFLEMCPELNDQEIVFISGKVKKNIREDWRQDAIKDDRKIILIGTYPVFQAGLNIPSLQHVFFISPSKSKIRVMQSIGRSLRLYNRKDRAYVYDFIDNLRWFDKQAAIREKFYLRDDFDLEEEVYYERDFTF